MLLTSTQLISPLADDLMSCRQRTLDWFDQIDESCFYRQIHPDFSPIGWHLGHIAYTEACWILERCAGLPPQFPQYHRLFAADGLPKAERQYLPDRLTLRLYLDQVREKVWDYFAIAPLNEQTRLWLWLLQHESQHNETIAFLKQLFDPVTAQVFKIPVTQSLANWEDRVEIPGGKFILGSDDPDAQDNERPAQVKQLATYWIDRYPVTCAQYRRFMALGGYQQRQWWSEAGWRWLQDYPVNQPLYWCDSPDWADHPVCGVSAYEAEAYASFVGKRLPTEAEWEKAANYDARSPYSRRYPWGDNPPQAHHANFDTRLGHTTPVQAFPDGKSALGCYDLLGNVWEWTASIFEPYDDFSPYPYPGYSQSYFDGEHRVMRGGSWATRPWGLRNSFRNWYHPGVRQVLVGFRCAHH